MKRNFAILKSNIPFEKVIVIGDLMDGGRETNNQDFMIELDRFNRIFRLEQETLFMAGNHDIGFQKINPKIVDRFTSTFHPHSLNYVFNISGVKSS